MMICCRRNACTHSQCRPSRPSRTPHVRPALPRCFPRASFVCVGLAVSFSRTASNTTAGRRHGTATRTPLGKALPAGAEVGAVGAGVGHEHVGGSGGCSARRATRIVSRRGGLLPVAASPGHGGIVAASGWRGGPPPTQPGGWICLPPPPLIYRSVYKEVSD